MWKIYLKIRKLFINQQECLKINEELLWSTIFNSTIKNSEWFANQNLSPGRWALGYPGLYILYRILNDVKPKSSIEFGLGESSKLFCQYKLYYFQEYRVVEHNKEWARRFSEKFYKLDNDIIISDLKSIYKGKRVKYFYNNVIDRISDRKYDFVCVDGPFGGDYEGRGEILDMIKHNLLSDQFVILLDDTERESEQQTLRNIYKLLDKQSIQYRVGEYEGQKRTTIITSIHYSFLTTL